MNLPSQHRTFHGEHVLMCYGCIIKTEEHVLDNIPLRDQCLLTPSDDFEFTAVKPSLCVGHYFWQAGTTAYSKPSGELVHLSFGFPN